MCPQIPLLVGIMVLLGLTIVGLAVFGLWPQFDDTPRLYVRERPLQFLLLHHQTEISDT
jgi:hypothetical protein